MRCNSELRERVRELANVGYDEFAVAYAAGTILTHV